jgi:hypothetical protein
MVEGFSRIDAVDVRMMVLLSLVTGPVCGLVARKRLKVVSHFVDEFIDSL